MIKELLAKFRTSLWAQNIYSGNSGYEAAKTNPTRSSIDIRLQNARLDINKVTRQELIRKARYLYRNSPIVRGLIERLVTYTIGTGLHPTPATTNSEWNATALRSWKQWTMVPDLESRMPFETVQAVLFRSMLVDGDIFTLNTFGTSGRPRLQLIESQDITHKNLKGGVVDGIELNEFGRPEFYIWMGEERLPAEDVIHYMLPERAGQKRGITILHAIINTAHDIDDILALEKASVKDGSSKTDIIKTGTGELPEDDYIGKSLQGETSDGTLEDVDRYYRQVFGPEAKVLRNGDEFTPYTSKRPSPAWQGFMNFLVESVCYGAGLPPSLLMGTKVGGADTRREVATAQRVIDSWQKVFIGQLQRVYEYVIEEDIRNGNLSNPPKDWRLVEWQFPPRLTVDAGREADSDREDVKAGLLTRREYFARWGLDWKEQTKQAAEEAAYMNQLAEEYGISRGEIAMLDPNEISKEEKSEPSGSGRKNPESRVNAKRPRDEKGRFVKTSTVQKVS